jgi:bifunctional DNase/RNase
MRKTGRGLAQGVLAATILLSATAWAAEPQKTNGSLYEMEVMGVAPDPASGAPVVYLRGIKDKRELSMFIGPFEAQGIILPLQRTQPPRPYTHDLLLEAIHRLQAKVKRVVITEMREGTYFADLVLDAQGKEVILDSRPSDAIALALRENAHILAAEKAFIRTPRAGRPEGDNP